MFNGKPRSLSLSVAAAALLAACGGAGAEIAHDDHGEHAHGEHAHGESMLLGAPADAAAADRTIEVTAEDPYSFSPERIEVSAGETIVFRVTNSGRSLHEFVLGPKEEHVHGEDGDTAIQLRPGETKELAWTFPEAGEMEFNCYVPGHSEAGMKGTIAVSS